VSDWYKVWYSYFDFNKDFSMRMKSSKPHSEFWNDGLKLVSYCPVCETRYTPTRAHMLGKDGETRLLHVTCVSCKHAVLALVLVNEIGASSVGVLTDLCVDDVYRFHALDPVSINEVIDVHTFCEEGIFDQLLESAYRKSLPETPKKRVKRTSKRAP